MTPNARIFNVKHQRFWLLPQKAIYWQKRKILLVADLHIGKSAHFRKNGIAVPGRVAQSNLNKLDTLIDITEPEHLIILGDLFHSDINNEWQRFVTWRKKHLPLEVSLVAGNHDILDKRQYHSGIINLFKKLTVGPFLLVHDINEFQDSYKSGQYILSGHIHPAVQLQGTGRQTMKWPCFYFGKNYGILPAWGEFTGTHVIHPNEKDEVFIIANSKILSSGDLKHE